MKKIHIKILLLISILILILSTVSCKKEFLDQKPTSALTELSYYKTIPELETGLVSCYAAVQSSWFELDIWVIEDIGSDDADKGSTPNDMADITEVSYSRQLSSNGILYAWSDFYILIARCNKVIDKSAGVSAFSEEDKTKIERIVEQAKFIRALCYYYLVIDFGDVPLVTRFLNPGEVNLTRTPAAEVWTQIEKDLNDATNLPKKSEWNRVSDQSGRITSGAAYSLLGKVYLTQKKYELANNAFEKVVQSGEYQLVSDFGKIFRKEGENCEESVFEIQHDNQIHDGISGTWWGNAWRMPRDDGSGGWGFDCPTMDLLTEFEPGDPRIIYTFIFPGDEFPGRETGSIYTAVNNWSPTGYNSRKVWIPWSERAALDFWNWDMNSRYMRYAEVLLLYAESLNEMDKPDEALYFLNMVRRRARNTPTTDPQRISYAGDLSYTGSLLPDITVKERTALRQAIWHEQRVELAIEGKRRGTLLRTNRFIERMETAKKYAGVTVQPYELLLPIPRQEIELSNFVLIQNPGY
jgi:starch-binding outer membrane protein, SusD/RagB family